MKKLELRRQTLRHLNPDEKKQVVGGLPPYWTQWVPGSVMATCCPIIHDPTGGDPTQNC